jgi:hypothetical protein
MHAWLTGCVAACAWLITGAGFAETMQFYDDDARCVLHTAHCAALYLVQYCTCTVLALYLVQYCASGTVQVQDASL